MPIGRPHHHVFQFKGFDYWTAWMGEAEEVQYVTKTYVCTICNQSRTVHEKEHE